MLVLTLSALHVQRKTDMCTYPCRASSRLSLAAFMLLRRQEYLTWLQITATYQCPHWQNVCAANRTSVEDLLCEQGQMGLYQC